jgi:hypothetical protein
VKERLVLAVLQANGAGLKSPAPEFTCRTTPALLVLEDPPTRGVKGQSARTGSAAGLCFAAESHSRAKAVSQEHPSISSTLLFALFP